jgi:hypothetical protein
MFELARRVTEAMKGAHYRRVRQVADALRVVGARMQQAIDAGQRSRTIDADDLVEVLLAVADELDPPVRGAADSAETGNQSPTGH